MDFSKIFNTNDPDNHLGPLVLAAIIAVVVLIFGLAFGLSHH